MAKENSCLLGTGHCFVVMEKILNEYESPYKSPKEVRKIRRILTEFRYAVNQIKKMDGIKFKISILNMIYCHNKSMAENCKCNVSARTHLLCCLHAIHSDVMIEFNKERKLQRRLESLKGRDMKLRFAQEKIEFCANLLN